uniref:Mast cell immunoglobulin like receptor 1 n=1 Tax=Catagonus wagneri TaxID=51154 RepID=A0A8C4FFK9_9CETA
MWSHLNQLCFGGIFPVTLQKAALDCERMKKTNGFPSPNLESKTNAVMRGQNVSLFCSNQNKSLQIKYTLFLGEKSLGSRDGKGEPAMFNQRLSEAHDLGPYKCKAQVSNCSTYSYEFNFTFVGGDSCPFCLQLLLPGLFLVLILIILVLTFWMLPKYKARKAMKDNEPIVYGNTSTEVGTYANICNNQEDKESVPDSESRHCVPIARDGTECSQEIHYATPMFQEVAPRDQEAYNDCKTHYVYSELNF